MKIVYRITILILAFVMSFSSVVLINTEDTFAASKPSKITNFRYSSKTETEISLSWNKASNAKKYQLAYHLESGKWKYKTVTSKKYKMTDLSEYTKYYFKVRGVNGKRYGAWSDTISVYTDPSNVNYDYLPSVVNLRVTRKGPGSISLAWDIKFAEFDTSSIEDYEHIDEESKSLEPEVKEAYDETVTEDSATSTDSNKETSSPINQEETPSNNETKEIGNSVEETQETEMKADEAPELQPFEDYKFMVQMLMRDGTWKTLTNALSAGTTTFRIGELDMGTAYSFRVVAIDTSTWEDYCVINEEGYSDTVSDTTNIISGVSIKQSYTTRNKIYKQHRSLVVKGLMLHSVGANKQSAKTWFDIYNRENFSSAAVHAFIDGTDGKVWQTMPWSQRAGHAGTKANDAYIGVEMCESKYIKYKSGTKFTVSSANKADAKACAKRTYDVSVNLFAYLCDAYNLDPLKKGTIYSHNEWRKLINFGHYDPEHYWTGLGTGYTMNGFRADVAEALNNSQTTY